MIGERAVSLFRKLTSRLAAWLYRPRNPLMQDPEYARLTLAIEAARERHRNARALREERQRRLHTMLAAGTGR
jgi:hypothetical protein